MIFSKDTKILIVGLGLMGGSYAQAFTDLGFTVGATDPNEDSIKWALENKIIESGNNFVSEDYIKDFDLIIFAVYPHIIIDWLKKYQHLIKKNALLTDVTGVKSCFIYDAQKILRRDLEFIGAHPMAGRESSGVHNAKKEIFKNANFIITPTNENTIEAIEVSKKMGELLGVKNISVLSPEKHDEMIAFLSQLAHCIAITLMTCRDSESFAAFTGDSFRDLTRIAKINDEMWSELFLLNEKELLKQMKFFKSKFNWLYKNIKHKNKANLRRMMKESTSKRINFDKI